MRRSRMSAVELLELKLSHQGTLEALLDALDIEHVEVDPDDEKTIIDMYGDLDNLSMSKGLLDRSPKKNWVERAGGLPSYIEKIADSIHRKRGLPISRAISVAVGVVKRWARGGGDVNADTRAKAAKAVAQWEKLKLRNKAKKALKND